LFYFSYHDNEEALTSISATRIDIDNDNLSEDSNSLCDNLSEDNDSSDNNILQGLYSDNSDDEFLSDFDNINLTGNKS